MEPGEQRYGTDDQRRTPDVASVVAHASDEHVFAEPAVDDCTDSNQYQDTERAEYDTGANRLRTRSEAADGFWLAPVPSPRVY